MLVHQRVTALGYQHVFSSMNQAVRRQALRRPPRWADPAGKKGCCDRRTGRWATNCCLFWRGKNIEQLWPIGSMYGIYANIGGILMGSMLPYIAYMDPMGDRTQLLSNWVFSMGFILSSFSSVHCSTTNVLQNPRCKLDATSVTYDSAVSSSSLCHRGDCGSVPAALLWFGVSGLCSWCTLRFFGDFWGLFKGEICSYTMAFSWGYSQVNIIIWNWYRCSMFFYRTSSHSSIP